MKLRRVASGRWFVVTALAMAGVMLLAVRLARSGDADSAVREEWTELLDCLSGGGPRGSAAEIARRARHVELEHLTHASSVEGEAARRGWFSRCTRASTRLLARLPADDSPRDHRWRPWKEAVGEIRRSFKSERLPSLELLREALEEAEKLGLTPMNLPSDAHSPIARAPQLSLESLSLSPITTGPVSLAASDPVPSRDVHLLLEQEGSARACVFASTEPALSSYRCVDIPTSAATDSRWRWESPNQLRGDFLTHLANGRSHVYRMGMDLVDMGSVDGEMLGVVGAASEATFLSATMGTQVSFHGVELDRLRLLRRVNVDGLSWALPFADEVVWASSSRRSGEQDSITVTSVGALSAYPAGGRELATIFERAVPLACETETSRTVLLTKGVNRTAFSWDGDLVVLRRDAEGWSSPMTANARWATIPSAGVAYPRTPTLSCRSNVATVTWTEGDSQTVVHQLQCTHGGCVTKLARLAGDYGDALVIDLDGKVLLVRNDIAHRIIRMRLARIEDLPTTRDVVLYDDGEALLPGSPSMALHAFVRESVALVLLRIARAEQTDLFAVRIDGSGVITLARRD